MFINNLQRNQKIFGSDFNLSLNFSRHKSKSYEFGFFESRLRRVYARLALGANFANQN